MPTRWGKIRVWPTTNLAIHPTRLSGRNPDADATGHARRPRRCCHRGRRRSRRLVLVSGGGGGSPTTTSQAAAPTTSGTTSQASPPPLSPAPPRAPAPRPVARPAPITTSRRGGAGSTGLTTAAPTSLQTTTTRPQVSPQASTSAAVNIAAPNGFGLAVRSLWVDARPGGVHMSVADVASALPGSVFYAEQPAIGTYWAVSRFVPSTVAQARAGTTAGNAVAGPVQRHRNLRQGAGEALGLPRRVHDHGVRGAVPSPVLNSWGMCS